MDPMKPMRTMEPMRPVEEIPPWWPDGLGAPGSVGSQGGVRYAVFPAARRLAVQRDGRVRLYDTGGHRIGGVSQAEGAEGALVFTGQDGEVPLDALTPVG